MIFHIFINFYYCTGFVSNFLLCDDNYPTPPDFKKLFDYFFLLVASILLMSDIYGNLNFVSHHFIRVNFLIHKTCCNKIIIVWALWPARQQTEYLFKGQGKRNCGNPVNSNDACSVNKWGMGKKRKKWAFVRVGVWVLTSES